MSKVSKGMGEWQSNTRIENRMKILEILGDGEYHQYNEIKERTQLSSPVLAKHLKGIKNWIEKKEGDDDSRTKYYRANATLRSIMFNATLTKNAWTDVKKSFIETKDMALAIQQINTISNLNLLLALSSVQEKNINISDFEQVQLFVETFVWNTYKILTLGLIDLSIKTGIIDSVNLEQVAKNLAGENKNGSAV